MKRWAVGYYTLNENVLTIEVIFAATWQQAVSKHSKLTDFWECFGECKDIGDPSLVTLEEAKDFAYDYADEGLDVVEIPQ
jgi:hypothetical protein